MGLVGSPHVSAGPYPDADGPAGWFVDGMDLRVGGPDRKPTAKKIELRPLATTTRCRGILIAWGRHVRRDNKAPRSC